MGLNENNLAEQPVIEWLKKLGYEYLFGPDIGVGGAFQERNDYKSVVLEGRLKRSLRRINPEIPEEKIDQVKDEIIKFTHQDIELGNKDVFKKITEGITVEVKDKNGDLRGKFINILDFEHPENNEFLVVNQFSVQGINDVVRIPDVVIFINGIPVVVFELKNPTDSNATIATAFSQLQDTYKRDIPKIFYYNQILVVSDLFKARHGTVSATWDFFAPWKGIEIENEKTDLSELELLVKGMLPKERLLDIIQNFIVFEADAEKDATKFTKKMAMYHQYFGVNRAVNNTLNAIKGDKKIGVFWHTQGSGKSLSMVFYVNKVKKMEELNGPTLLFITDRNDLDNQFFKTFLRTGYTTAKQADSIRNLKNQLRGSGSEVLFTTIQKFELKEELSKRENIIIIADEAHRSEYGIFAGNVRKVLPNASFMGITGTPIAFEDKNTQLVFGLNISEYPIDRSVEDGTTVPIYYEGRLIPLHVMNEFIDEDFDELLEERGFAEKEFLKKKWAKVEQAIGSEDRLQEIADDIIFHFNNRGIEGKAMIVTMSRRIAVEMYNLILKNENAPEVAVVISSNQEYKDKIQKELDNKEIEKRFKNPEDSLKIVIVCDMWLTGFDVPVLNTIYLDKPLKGHTLMQAIARVNRRYKDKEGGLIVDYIGVAENLKKALAIYTSDIQKQAMIPVEQLIEKMLEVYEQVKKFFADIEYKNWKSLGAGELATLFAKAVNLIITDKDTGNVDVAKKDEYLKFSMQLYKLFALIMPHRQAYDIKDEIEFFEGVRKAIIKNTVITDPTYIDEGTETAIKDLISKSVVAEGVLDIFAQKGKEKPNISILDDKFLEEIKESHFKNLTIQAIEKLINDELRNKMRFNLVKYRSLMKMLEKIIEEYENNIINSSKVIEKLIELAKEIKKVEVEDKEIGLSPEESAFYSILSHGKKSLKEKEIRDLVKELVRTIKRDIAIDWTNHEIIKARIRANVRLTLLRYDFPYENVDEAMLSILDQAESLYKDLPMLYLTS